MPRFDKLKNDKNKNDEFNELAKKSSEKAVVVMAKRIKNDNLFDYQYNTEDITDTADLEESIRQLGFIDPIEVTDYGMADGEFTIISGHRRRAAGVKQGITVFPCLVRQFNNEAEIKNYVLLANSHRDSSKDPLLIAKRYRANKKYLEEQGQTYNFREEIAKRLGLSPRQADRYNQLLDVIPEVWGLIQTNIVGMSSVIKMASYKEEEQYEILDMLMECYNEGLPLSRERCGKIISAYDKGIRHYEEIKENGIDKFDNASEDGYDIDSDMNIDDTQQEIPSESVIPEYSGENAEEISTINNESSDIDTDDKKGNVDGKNNGNEYRENREEKKDNTPIIPNAEQKNQKGLNIKKNIETLESSLNEIYDFNSEETAVLTVQAIKNIIKTMLKESEKICLKYNNKDLFNNGVKELSDELKKYIAT